MASKSTLPVMTSPEGKEYRPSTKAERTRLQARGYKTRRVVKPKVAEPKQAESKPAEQK